MELMEVWAVLSGVVLTTIIGIMGWIIHKVFEHDSQIAVLESHIEGIKEDIKDIKKMLIKISDNMNN